ncbi:hypothetical protein Tco_0105957 [Tanacetum coccineum]
MPRIQAKVLCPSWANGRGKSGQQCRIRVTFLPKHSIMLSILCDTRVYYTTRQVMFRIDLVTGDSPISHGHPYSLAPSEMKETSGATTGREREPQGSGLGMTIGLDLPKPNLEAQTDAESRETINMEDCWEHFMVKSVVPVCGAEVGQVQLTSPELVQETTEKSIQIKQKDSNHFAIGQRATLILKRNRWSFKVGDKVMLKV